jgi:hypothetical protein
VPRHLGKWQEAYCDWPNPRRYSHQAGELVASTVALDADPVLSALKLTHYPSARGVEYSFLYSNGVMTDLNTLIDPNLHIQLAKGFALR